jgi:hypothetical protein
MEGMGSPIGRRGVRAGIWGLMALFVVSCAGGDSGVGPPLPPDTRIGPSGGSTSSPDNRATLTVPAGSLSSPVQLSVTVLGSPPAGSFGPVYDIKPDGTQFNPPASLRLTLNPSELPAGVTSDRLRVATWRNGVWEPLPTQVSGGGATLTGEVRHLSVFGVVAVASPLEAACRELSLSTTAAAPTERVEVRGVTDLLTQGGLTADFRVAGNTRLFPTELAERGGRMELLVVPHPTLGITGGPVEVVISSGDFRCPGMSFTIRPLTAASGTLNRVVRVYEAIVVREMERWGFPPNGSSAPGPDVPAEVRGLDDVLGGIRGRDDGPSLRKLTDPATPGAPDLTMVEALLDRAGLVGALEQMAAALEGLPPSGLEDRARNPDSRTRWNPEWLTPAALESIMEAQAFFEGQTTGRNKNVYDAAGVGLTAAGIAAGTSGVGAPAAVALGTAASVVSSMVATFEILAGILPSELEPLELSGEPVSFEEDHPLPEGRWEAYLSASSKGYQVDWPTLASMLPGAGDVFKGLGRLGGRGVPVGELGTAALEMSLNFLNAQWGTLRALRNEQGIVLVPPKVSGPIRIVPQRDRGLFIWEVTTSAFELDGADPLIYRGLEEGPAILVVRSRPGRFAGKSASSSLDLEVRRIKVTLTAPNGSRAIYDAEPGEQVAIRAVVENAQDPCLRWSTPAGGAIAPPSACDLPTAVFTAPMDAGTYPVEAESTSRTGIRAKGVPRRTGFVSVRVGGLRLSPRPACVEVGETIRFIARKGGDIVPFNQLVVMVQGGTIGADGEFTGTTRGAGYVRISDPSNPDVKDEVNFRVANECVDWQMTLTGDTNADYAGFCPVYIPFEAFANPAAPVFRQPIQYYLYGATGSYVAAATRIPPSPLSEDGSARPAGPLEGAAIFLPEVLKAYRSRDGSPGLTVTHSWKLHPNGRSVILSGTMTGVLYRNPQGSLHQTDPGPVEVSIRFRGMRTNRTTELDGWLEQRPDEKVGQLTYCLRTGPELGG